MDILYDIVNSDYDFSLNWDVKDVLIKKTTLHFYTLRFTSIKVNPSTKSPAALINVKQLEFC